MREQRKAQVSRRTGETEVFLNLNLDGTGVYRVETGLPFFDHMLSLWARHGAFDLEVTARGDLAVDGHHTVEDVGICLGQALKAAAGEKAGVTRYGHACIPMDEALALAAVDLSGRGFLAFQVNLPVPRIGDFDTELVEEFLRALAINGEFTLHIQLLAGTNTHHVIEAVFKALSRAMRAAVEYDHRLNGIPSTKGVL
jgi:imidazoleglycerol-phosphate dehydratase